MRGATVLHIHNPPDIFFPAGALFRIAGRQGGLRPSRPRFRKRSRSSSDRAFRSGRASGRRAADVRRRRLTSSRPTPPTRRSRGAPAASARIRSRSCATARPRHGRACRSCRREGVLAEVRLAYLGAIRHRMASRDSHRCWRGFAMDAGPDRCAADGHRRRRRPEPRSRRNSPRTGSPIVSCSPAGSPRTGPGARSRTPTFVSIRRRPPSQRALDDDQAGRVPGARQAGGRLRPA